MPRAWDGATDTLRGRLSKVEEGGHGHEKAVKRPTS